MSGVLMILIAALAARPPAAAAGDLYARAQAIHHAVLTLDSHVDIPGTEYGTGELDPGIDNPRLRCDLVKMEMGGMDAVFLAVFTSQAKELNDEVYEKARRKALGQFEAIHRVVEDQYPNRCALARSPDDVERIVAGGKKAIVIGMENGFPLGTDLTSLDRSHELGARYITLCHTGHNQICDSSSPDAPLHHGLSDFGRQVVRRMNELGLICDASHISENSFYDLIEVSRAPVIASHSGCAAVHPHDRNLTDDQLRALARNGGVIQIVTLEQYLAPESPEREAAMTALRAEMGIPTWEEWRRMSEEQRDAIRPKLDGYYARRRQIAEAHPVATLNDFVDHIDHAVKVAGIDHVGIGTDFDGGGGFLGFADHSQAYNVTLELVKRGYDEEEIRKIWGGNFLRVWREVEATARRLDSALPTR
jgi:membrane dipeptidase